MTTKLKKVAEWFALIASIATIVAAIIAVINFVTDLPLEHAPKDVISESTTSVSTEEDSSMNTDSKEDSSNSTTAEIESTDSDGDENTSYEIPRKEIETAYNDGDFYIPTFNASEFSLSVSEKASSLRYRDSAHETFLGVYPSAKTPITVTLFDYKTRKVVDFQTAYMGNTFYFSDIPEGTYFYTIEGSGYVTTFSDNPFTLINDTNHDKHNLPWCDYIEKEGANYGKTFKVKLIDSSGNVVKDANTQVRVVKENDDNPNSFTSYTVYSNNNGYITIYNGIDGVDYYFDVDFSVRDGYSIQVQDSSGIYKDVSFVNEELGKVLF